MEIRGRQVNGGKSSKFAHDITHVYNSKDDFLRIRIDDDNNPEFWLELMFTEEEIKKLAKSME